MEFLQTQPPNNQAHDRILATTGPEQNFEPGNQIFIEEQKRRDPRKELDTSKYTEDYPPDYEKDLIERVKEGNPSAFGPIYNHWYPFIKKIAYFKTSSEVLAEDFASEAMWKALNKIDQLPDTARGFGPWIVTITQNLIRDHYKSASHNRTTTVADAGLFEPSNDGLDLTDQTTLELTRIAVLQQVKAKMFETGREDQFHAIIDVYLLGHSIKEAAKTRGITDGALKGLLYRGTRAALRILERKGYSKDTVL